MGVARPRVGEEPVTVTDPFSLTIVADSAANPAAANRYTVAGVGRRPSSGRPDQTVLAEERDGRTEPVAGRRGRAS